MQETQNLWKIVLRLYLQQEKINEVDFRCIYTNKCAHDEILDSISNLTDEDLLLSVKSLKSEASFLSKGELPEFKIDFKVPWFCYLIDLVEVGIISESDFDSYLSSIDFSKSNWLLSEIRNIDVILELYQMKLVTEKPEFLEYVDTPTYELLMIANGMDFL